MNAQHKTMRTLHSGGRERRYLQHVPANVSDDPDLVIALHALASNPRLMEAMTLFSSRSDDDGFIVCYPEGSRSPESGVTSWNASPSDRRSLAGRVDDVLFISDLIDALRDEHGIGRVLVTGFSKGGMLAHLIGVNLSDKVDMIAPVAATLGKDVLELAPRRPVDVMMVHGEKDDLVPYHARGDDRFPPAVEAERYWARVNGCSYVREDETVDAVVRHHGGTSCGVTSILVKNAGHVWPGGRARMGGEHDPKTVDATDLILGRFLSRG